MANFSTPFKIAVVTYNYNYTIAIYNTYNRISKYITADLL